MTSPAAETTATRYGEHLLNVAEAHGWPNDGGEGPLEFLLRRACEVGIEDARRSANGER